ELSHTKYYQMQLNELNKKNAILETKLKLVSQSNNELLKDKENIAFNYESNNGKINNESNKIINKLNIYNDKNDIVVFEDNKKQYNLNQEIPMLSNDNILSYPLDKLINEYDCKINKLDEYIIVKDKISSESNSE